MAPSLKPSESPHWQSMYHAIRPVEADRLCAEASKVPEGGVIVEVGSFKGSSTYALALGCVERNVKVYAVDTWMGSPGGVDEWGKRGGVFTLGSHLEEFKRNLKEFIDSGIVIPLEMSSAGALMYEPRLEPYLLFIDGSHQYEDVLFDVTCWWGRLKARGLMAVHDSSGAIDAHPQVRRALDNFIISHQCEYLGIEDSTSWLRK